MAIDIEKLIEMIEEKHKDNMDAVAWIGQAPVKQFKIGSFDKLVQESSMVFASVNSAFQNDKHLLGSWIAGIPLPLQLLWQPRLTVDLSVNELKKFQPYNMSWESFCSLVENGLLFLNFRDFDSLKRDNFLSLRGNENVMIKDRLSFLFKEYRSSIYIGSALRAPLFKFALRTYGLSKDNYEYYFAQAMHDLRSSYQCFSELKKNEKYKFRDEKVVVDAPSWHWTYMKCVSNFFENKKIIDGTNEDGVGLKLYNDAKRLGDEVGTSLDSEKKEKAANAFVELSKYLRSCHLAYTANITASFGTMYNLSKNESIEVGRLLMADKLVDKAGGNIRERYVSEIMMDLLRQNKKIDFNDGDLFDDSGFVAHLPEKNVVFNEHSISSIVAFIRHVDVNKLYELRNAIMEAYVSGDSNSISREAILKDYKSAKQALKDMAARDLAFLWRSLAGPVLGSYLSFGDQNVLNPFLAIYWAQTSAQIEAKLDELKCHFYPHSRRIRAMQRVVTTIAKM